MEKNNLTVGPWGGNGGSSWDDGRYTGVREIHLVYNRCIDSIIVVYDKQGQPFKATKHGGSGGNNVAVITLEYPGEFLISVSGHCGPLDMCRGGNSYIRSLTFKSNQRTFGPYGVEEGRRFTYSCYPVHEIVGFHGRSGLYLDSIGLHLSTARPRKDETGCPQKSLVVGPWGGNGGNKWDDGVFTGVREIKLVYGLCIDSIVVVYDKHGHPCKAQKHGGGGGTKTAEIKLQYPNEFLVKVSGYYGPINARREGDPYVRSLTFQSNYRSFGPYGVEEGKGFTYSCYPSQNILGFHGRSGWYLDSIGLHLSPAKPIQDEMGCPQKSLVVGPWGGNGGNKWDDGVFTGVREIKLVYGLCIDSFMVIYDMHGQLCKAQKHGGGGGNKTVEIKLQFPNEFLVNVSGHYGPINAWSGGDPYVKSLKFQSNYRSFGPYGVEEGKGFTYSCHPTQKIVGFHGRSGWYLDSIGLHLSPAKPRKDETGMPQKSLVVGPWGGYGGTAWDDGVFTGVREISLVYGLCIDSIVVVYDMHGQPIKAQKHGGGGGGGGGNKTAEIKLQYPNEILVHVNGHYGPTNARRDGDPYIRSLTFQSNYRSFGPYGVEEGTPFSFSTNGHQILGLKGRSGWYLDAIGFHLSCVM